MKKSSMRFLINALTILRIIGIPLLFFLDGVYLLVYLNLLFISDFLDGYLARKYQVESVQGAILDLLADKFLVIFLLIIFTLDHHLGWIISGLIIGREIYSIAMRAYFFSKNQKLIGASIIGKSKTFVQFVAFDLLVLNVWGYKIAFIIVIILSYYSIISYMIKGVKGTSK